MPTLTQNFRRKSLFPTSKLYSMTLPSEVSHQSHQKLQISSLTMWLSSNTPNYQALFATASSAISNGLKPQTWSWKTPLFKDFKMFTYQISKLKWIWPSKCNFLFLFTQLFLGSTSTKRVRLSKKTCVFSWATYLSSMGKTKMEVQVPCRQARRPWKSDKKSRNWFKIL